MPSLGEAYISVHADTTAFRSELEAQVKAATAAVEKSQNSPTARRATPSTTNSDAAALAAQTALNKKLYKADQDFRIAADKAAAQAIKDTNRNLAQQLQNDLNRQVAAEKAADAERVIAARAAADAIKAANRDTAQQLQNDLSRQVAAEKAANVARVAAAKEADDAIKRSNRDTAQQLENDLRRQQAAVKAAALAEKELARAAKEAADNNHTLGDRIVGLSSALSRIGFTGQTRLITLGLSVGAPVALLGAFSVAAAAATAAVTVFGIKSADAARSATLQFQSLGLSADQAKKQFADLQALSNKGLQIANLDADASLLLQLGITAENTTKILGTLGDIFSANGDTGATLQKDIDDTAKKFATLVNTAKITPRTFQTAVASLGIGVTAQEVFNQVKKNLDVTDKQLDKIIQKGKLSGSALAQAALQAAAPGSAGALSKAAASSPTQALEALKSSAQSTLANAFGASGTTIAGFINQVSTQLDAFLAKFAPKVIKTLQDTLPSLLNAIQPFGDALIATMQLVGPAFEAIGPIVSNLSNKITGFFSQFNAQGTQTYNFIRDLGTVFQELGIVANSLGPALNSIGNGLAAVVHDLADAKPVFEALAFVIKAITDNPLGNELITLAVVAGAAKLAIFLLNKALAQIITTAAGAAIAMRGTGAAAVTMGAEAATAATAVAGAEVAMGGAAIAAGVLSGALELLLPAFLAFEAGKWVGNLLFGGGGKKTLGEVGDAAVDLQARFANLDNDARRTGTSVDFLTQALTNSDGSFNNAALSALNLSIQAGSFNDVAGGLVKALEAGGDSADQAAIALEGMGVSADNAQAAVSGLDTSGANAQLLAFQVAALEADGAVRRTISDLQIAQQLGGTVNDPDGAFASAAAVKAATPIASSFDAFNPTPVVHAASGGGGGGAGGSAKAASDKIKNAFSQLSDDIKAIANKTSKQTADQIKSEFKALIKDLEDSDNKALVAGAKAVESRLLSNIDKLSKVKDKLSAELQIAQGVKDSVIASGAVDRGTGIATTFAGITNKLRFSVATTQQFTAVIKRLQAEKLNRTTIKQLIDEFSSDPTGALAAAQAIAGAGQAGVNQVNTLNTALQGAGNDLGNDVAGELFKQGQHIGDGLLEGLKSKEKDIEKLINKIGDDLSKNLKKKIKAHSPSEVFSDIGGDVADGLIQGLDGSARKVADASTRMGQTMITFGPGSVAVNNADPKNPAGSGLMVGHGIVGILERQQAQAVLAGVG